MMLRQLLRNIDTIFRVTTERENLNLLLSYICKEVVEIPSLLLSKKI